MVGHEADRGSAAAVQIAADLMRKGAAALGVHCSCADCDRSTQPLRADRSALHHCAAAACARAAARYATAAPEHRKMEATCMSVSST